MMGSIRNESDDRTTRIFELKEQDLPDLAELYRQFRGEESSLDEMRETFRRLKRDPDYTFLCARDGGRLLGSVLGIVCEELYGDCRPFMVVEDVIVDKEQRRRGIGSMLMRAIEEQAGNRNCSYIMLVTDSTRIDAQGFYQSLGYHPEDYKGYKKYLNNSGVVFE